MPAPVGGLFSVGFDYKKLCADPDLKVGIEKIAGALERATTSPMNLDKTVIDGMVQSLELFLASLVVAPSGGLVVGAAAPAPMSSVDAANAIGALEASTGITVSADAKAKVAAHPEVMRLIKNRAPHWQAKFLNSAWLDTVIQWLTTYGATLVQFLLVLLPLFI